MGAPQEDGVESDKAVAPATETVATETATAAVPAAPVEAQPQTETAPPANA